ncbi:hypothetical protein ANANG_G00056820 [Anguilla anguilla]|uniref:Uncharacterized protein n=1 Tax=Anguilla anguilla TaxID=7936 RepID=A0A9D3S6J2_ANGAN|nr:hypothetical protein ANANG_G00056820 [Anguilla anguilla]
MTKRSTIPCRLNTYITRLMTSRKARRINVDSCIGSREDGPPPGPFGWAARPARRRGSSPSSGSFWSSAAPSPDGRSAQAGRSRITHLGHVLPLCGSASPGGLLPRSRPGGTRDVLRRDGGRETWDSVFFFPPTFFFALGLSLFRSFFGSCVRGPAGGSRPCLRAVPPV